jgi:hypothetical protein
VLRLRRWRGYAQHEREISRLCGPQPFALNPSTGSGQATGAKSKGGCANLMALPLRGEGQGEGAAPQGVPLPLAPSHKGREEKVALLCCVDFVGCVLRAVLLVRLGALRTPDD